jgi:hypothetical protein
MNSIDNRDLQCMFSITSDLQDAVAVRIQQRQCAIVEHPEMTPSGKVEAVLLLQRIQDEWMRRTGKELRLLDDMIVW